MSKRPALIAITRRGAERAVALGQAWPEAAIYLTKPWIEAPGVSILSAPLSDHAGTLLHRHDPVIFFCALGAVVRLIAPHLRTKREDPAVLAVDETARFVLPVVSGHLGGANRWAEKLARKLGALPVITTASEALALPAVDLLGRESGWEIEAIPTALTRAAACVVNGEPTALVQEWGETGWRDAFSPWPEHLEILSDLAQADPRRHRALLWITREADAEKCAALARQWPESLVIYRPPLPVGALALGAGCDRGASLATLEEALDQALAGAGLERRAIAALATIDRKGDEPALRALAERLGLPLTLFTAEQLGEIPVPNPSAMVQGHVGSPSVAEAAALLVARGEANRDLLVPKTRRRGEDGKNVTLALARFPHPNPSAREIPPR
ncbi:MAG: cobalamin biosynthesis protein [Magnetococcales bacterium]|nr:cobalamin biosynthesis protein [Magnetococcales bacterium]